VFTPDGNKLALVVGEQLELWNVLTGKRVAVARKGGGPIGPIALSADGRLLASGSWGTGIMQVWDVVAQKEMCRFRDYASSWGPLRFTLDGKTLVVARQSTIAIWDIAGLVRSNAKP
jgi:WD40 repeat protein